MARAHRTHGAGGYNPPPPPPSTDPRDAPLSDDERAFVLRWFALRNRTAAYLEAFPHVAPRSAAVHGSEFSNRPHVKAYYQALVQAQARRVNATADESIREVMRIAYSDPYYLYDENNCVLPVRRMPFEMRRAIASVKVGRERVTSRRTTTRKGKKGTTKTTVVTTEQTVEVKLWPKLEAQKMLGQFFGWVKPGQPELEAMLALFPKDIADEARRHLAVNRITDPPVNPATEGV